MQIPEFWAEAKLATEIKGRRRSVRRFGWSDTSQADGYPAFAAVRDGESCRIRVGAERYEIPRSVVLGP